MIYREFGNTGIMLSAIGFGANRLNALDLQDEDGLERIASLMAVAINECGINYIDCGHTYAMGMAEKIIGRAIPKFKAECHLCVKVMYYEDPKEATAYQRILESLRVYGVTEVSFGFLWKVTSYDEFIRSSRENGTLAALVKAKENGLIKHICVSLHTSPEESIRILDSGYFEGCIVSCNAMNMESFLGLFEYARSKNIGIITMNSLGGGMLAGSIPGIDNRLLQMDRKYSSVQNALRALFSNEAVTCMLSSMQDEVQLRENCEPFASDQIFNFHQTQNFHLGKVKYCTRCRYCMKGCPAHIQISDLMYAYSCRSLTAMMGGYGGFVKENGSNEDASIRLASEVFNSRFFDYGAIPKTIDNPCIKCGKCNRICTQSLDVMGTVHKIYSMSARFHFSHEQRKERLKKIIYQKDYKNIGFFPAGKYTNYVIEAIVNYFGKPEFQIRLYDNDDRKWGKRFNGYLCYGMDDIGLSDLVLITSYNYGDVIYEQLKRIVSEDIEIIQLHDKDRDVAWF